MIIITIIEFLTNYCSFSIFSASNDYFPFGVFLFVFVFEKLRCL